MLDVLRNTTYRHLFLAQIIALLGTGLATVALGLLAFDLAGANAGAVLGTALAIKMVAYIGVAPVASAFAERLPRKTVLVALDLIRAAVALVLPFVTQIWQIYILIFVLQSASAAFTPTFQATIPDVLPDEEQYTRALSLSRLAYDMESLVSPALAALLLSVVSYHALFGGTVIGFVASAILVVSAVLPRAKVATKRGIYDRTTRGLRIYLATPRLQGLLALNLAIAAGSAMVIVNTVVLVQSKFGLSQTFTAAALATFGTGSMLVALMLPIVLEHLPERRVMLGGAMVIAAGLLLGFVAAQWYSTLVVLWFVLGLGYSLAQTPSGRLFAAQFALSHACWLITYPLAGWLGAKAGLSTSFLVLGAVAVFSVILAGWLWRAEDSPQVSHTHDALPAGHPHLVEHKPMSGPDGRTTHAHEFGIDDDHPKWPSH
jgi:predicted MFS family arabinose efflux permease